MRGNARGKSRTLWARGIVALCAGLIVAAGGGASAAPVETVLYSFKGGSDGNEPFAGVIADSSGNLYGATSAGGTSGNGVVFKLSPGGTETVLYSFCSLPGCSDGSDPVGGLIADSEGNLYGATSAGGTSGNGVVFKLSPGGTETVLYSFCSLPGCSDGSDPVGGLIADSSGNLYGATSAGGASEDGVVFKLTPGGTETVLYSFCSLPGCSDGSDPVGGLIADSEGNLYGATSAGGTSGNGVVFKLSPGGTETLLYSFTGGSDGSGPVGLIADSEGNLYGATYAGGARVMFCPAGCGVVFKLSPGGTETVLHSFTGFSDGMFPAAGLIADSSGNLYGTTENGGPPCSDEAGCGVVFKLSPSGTETVLYSFMGGISDGRRPFAGLIADSSGNLYGTTAVGGAADAGTLFKLTGTGFVPAVPFAAFSPTAMIDFGKTPNTDAFILKSSFTLGSTSKGIDPLAQPVSFQIGALALTIPPGSFTGTVTSSAFGPFFFAGTINGVSLHAAIAPTGAKRFLFQAGAHNASLTGTVNPVPVTLTIGNNNGAASATILLPPASKVH